MKKLLTLLLFIIVCIANTVTNANEPYTIELEEIPMPGTPAIHSFAFAESNGKWLFIGGRTNGLHGFTPATAFPKQFSNKYIYVIDPVTMQTWSRNIFIDFHFTISDQLRSANMESKQEGNRLYIAGGYGYDSTINSLRTFPKLTVIDVEEMIQGIISGSSISNFLRQTDNAEMQVAGGELGKLGDYFYLIGGHKFTGGYRRGINNQVYTNQIRKFKINDNGITVNISDYSALTDTVEFHRRDMNVIPAIKPDGIGKYLIWYGGVFKYNANLPYLNPVYIDETSATVDYSFEQKMTQYTTAHLTAFNNSDGSMNTTFFGGTSLYSYNDITNVLEYDSLVPFINDITTLTRLSNGSSIENISSEKMPALLGTNAKFILNKSIPHYDNEVIKLNQLTGRTFAGYIYGGIRALLPNNGNSFPSEYVFKVYITPDFPLPVELSSFTSSVNKRDVKLNWTTASEENNSGFDIEKSNFNNSSWLKIGYVRGIGNSNIQKNYSFEDKNLNSGKYKYRLKQIDFNGNYRYFELSNDVNIETPESFSLNQNYPNPFNPNTIINYQLNAYGKVTLKIFNTTGKEVATLVNEYKEAGYYSINFSAAEGTANLSNGVYYYRLESGIYSETKKMVLIK